jgi:hypothetical protein
MENDNFNLMEEMMYVIEESQPKQEVLNEDAVLRAIAIVGNLPTIAGNIMKKHKFHKLINSNKKILVKTFKKCKTKDDYMRLKKICIKNCKIYQEKGSMCRDNERKVYTRMYHYTYMVAKECNKKIHSM